MSSGAGLDGGRPAAPAAPAAVCRICGERASRTYSVREMMHGTREAFDYVRCDGCGCLQIAAYPPDMSRFYGSGYYSMAAPGDGHDRPGALRLLKRVRNRYLATGRGPLGALLARLQPYRHLDNVGRLRLPRTARILDVGCGAGTLLCELAGAGFRNLAGADPFLAADASPLPGVRLRRASLAEVDGAFDLVMLNHSLEHMPDQQAQLRHVARLIAPGGACMIRVPLAEGEAWERYGTDWVQLDAPRHFYLHTRASLLRLATAAGLAPAGVHYDSTGFQFVGSELYRRGLSLDDGLARADTIFSPAELAAFERTAEALNAAGRGDQAVFYFRRPDSA